MKKLINKIQRELKSSLISPFAKKITPPHNFSKAYADAKKIYLARYANFSYGNYVVPDWLKNIQAMEDAFLHNFHFNFLRLPVIRATMIVISTPSWKKNQLDYLESKLDTGTLKSMLTEYNVGKPILADFKYTTSTNSIHLLYHFIKFSSELSVDLKNLSTVIEFGGGYGDAAKIFKTINPQATYIITDLPIFSFVQLVYLQSIFGKEEVFLVNDVRDVQKGKINIIPFDAEKLSMLKEHVKSVDLFISTWALSETPKQTQDLIKSLNYFDTRYILMGYQKSNSDFTAAENVKNVPADYTVRFNKETDYTPDSYYLFCEKK